MFHFTYSFFLLRNRKIKSLSHFKQTHVHHGLIPEGASVTFQPVQDAKSVDFQHIEHWSNKYGKIYWFPPSGQVFNQIHTNKNQLIFQSKKQKKKKYYFLALSYSMWQTPFCKQVKPKSMNCLQIPFASAQPHGYIAHQ